MHLRPPACSPVARPPAPPRRGSAPCPPARPRALGVAALGLAAGLAGACGGDLTGLNSANAVDTQETTFALTPLGTATLVQRSAVNLYGLAAVRPGIVAVTVSASRSADAPNFDFAVDRAADGRVRLLPSKLIAGLQGVGLPLETGFQVVSTAFADVAEAPGGTYARDSATVIGVGQTVIAEAQSAACYGGLRPNLYAKLVVDSIAGGTVYLRARVDPNCGFRSLREGKPTG